MRIYSEFTNENLNHILKENSLYLGDKLLKKFRYNIINVYKAFNKINKNKSLGPDMLILNVLKEVKEEIAEQ